ncbi:LysE/ArgO family amino acid transporter [Microbacterium stercoris]|uniref:LysE/ArgO family amino acid transporter n=1 Tax=Microbacterium stercoris TaxID=2820289 RepID=UPI0027DD21F6|nr:LysE family transporter [Microbacterium stercoris]
MLIPLSSPGFTALIAGLGLTLSLIIAPGAQNIFLLRMGILRRHIVVLALICMASDALLIAAGVAGFGAVVRHVPWLFDVVRWFGVAFLVFYGLSAAWRAWRPSGQTLVVDEPAPTPAGSGSGSDAGSDSGLSLGTGTAAVLTREVTAVAAPTRTLVPAILSCLAMTWLNPHAYLDTVFLIGSVSAGYGDLRWLFGAGAVLGSVIWFTFLAYASRYAARLLRSPRSWRILDALIAVAMLALAASLALS